MVAKGLKWHHTRALFLRAVEMERLNNFIRRRKTKKYGPMVTQGFFAGMTGAAAIQKAKARLRQLKNFSCTSALSKPSKRLKAKHCLRLQSEMQTRQSGMEDESAQRSKPKAAAFPMAIEPDAHWSHGSQPLQKRPARRRLRGKQQPIRAPSERAEPTTPKGSNLIGTPDGKQPDSKDTAARTGASGSGKRRGCRRARNKSDDTDNSLNNSSGAPCIAMAQCSAELHERSQPSAQSSRETTGPLLKGTPAGEVQSEARGQATQRPHARIHATHFEQFESVGGMTKISMASADLHVSAASAPSATRGLDHTPTVRSTQDLYDGLPSATAAEEGVQRAATPHEFHRAWRHICDDRSPLLTPETGYTSDHCTHMEEKAAACSGTVGSTPRRQSTIAGAHCSGELERHGPPTLEIKSNVPTWILLIERPGLMSSLRS